MVFQILTSNLKYRTRIVTVENLFLYLSSEEGKEKLVYKDNDVFNSCFVYFSKYFSASYQIRHEIVKMIILRWQHKGVADIQKICTSLLQAEMIKN